MTLAQLALHLGICSNGLDTTCQLNQDKTLLCFFCNTSSKRAPCSFIGFFHFRTRVGAVQKITLYLQKKGKVSSEEREESKKKAQKKKREKIRKIGSSTMFGRTHKSPMTVETTCQLCQAKSKEQLNERRAGLSNPTPCHMNVLSVGD